MHSDVDGLGTCEVSVSEAQAELERVLSDDRLRLGDRQRGILNYLAKRRFDGHHDGVKAYVIALDVLGRPVGFDALSDPIVRIEISRLRSLLEGHYNAHGGATDVWISIPKGQYVALFSKRDNGIRPLEGSG